MFFVMNIWVNLNKKSSQAIAVDWETDGAATFFDDLLRTVHKQSPKKRIQISLEFDNLFIFIHWFFSCDDKRRVIELWFLNSLSLRLASRKNQLNGLLHACLLLMGKFVVVLNTTFWRLLIFWGDKKEELLKNYAGLLIYLLEYGKQVDMRDMPNC